MCTHDTSYNVHYYEEHMLYNHLLLEIVEI